MTLAELLASKKQGTGRFPSWSLADLLERRNEPLDAKFNPSGVGPGVSYGSLASILADFTPGIGDVKSGIDAVREAASGNYGMSLADALGALPLIGGVGAIKAYHGSPHTFDAFDMSKIGTGEGAQAYGHGLYFAESPDVAKDYKNRLSGGADPYFYDWNGKTYEGGVKGDPIAHAIGLTYHQGKKTAVKIAQMGLDDAMRGEAYAIDQGGVDYYKKMLETAKSLNKKDIKASQGNLYETSLEWPDPAREAADPLGPQHFLDWDKPLTAQPRHTYDAIRAAYMDKLIDAPSTGPIGPMVIDMQRNMGSSRDAIKRLNEAGIPGIRYLDQGSRGAGDGTYNYVVFDDKIPRIVSRNGVTLADLLKR